MGHNQSTLQQQDRGGQVILESDSSSSEISQTEGQGQREINEDMVSSNNNDVQGVANAVDEERGIATADNNLATVVDPEEEAEAADAKYQDEMKKAFANSLEQVPEMASPPPPQDTDVYPNNKIAVTIPKLPGEKIGISFRRTADGQIYIANVSDDSPFAGSGLESGQQVLSIGAGSSKHQPVAPETKFQTVQELVDFIKTTSGVITIIVQSTGDVSTVSATVPKPRVGNKVGVSFRRDAATGTLTVSRVTHDSPFHYTGLAVGQKVETINGQLFAAFDSIEEVAESILQGNEGVVSIETTRPPSEAGDDDFATTKSMPRSTNTNKSKGILIGVIIIVIIVVVAITIPLTRNSGNDGDTEDAVDVPEEDRNANMTDVQDYLVANGVSMEEDLVDMQSPQGMAVDWLANEDDRNLPLPSGGLDDDAEGYPYIARYVMAVLYFAMNGPNWHNQFDFLSDGDVCSWNGDLPDSSGENDIPYGVVCNDDGKIWAIYLDSTRLEGVIPGELALLQELMAIDLSGNEEITGPFPISLCFLSNLQDLSLGFTQLSGSIPSCLGQVREMRNLFLSATLMDGPLPEDLERLSNLERLFLDNNMFSGTVDDEFLARHDKLVQVDLSNNLLTSTNFPTHLLELPVMTLLDMSNNRLEGELPFSLDSNQVLTHLSLADNQLFGSIGRFGLGNLVKLSHLDVSSNGFTGDLRWIEELEDLEVANLGNNSFSGNLPMEVLQLPKLQYLLVHNNDLEGLLLFFVGSQELKVVSLHDNNLVGDVSHLCDDQVNLELLAVDCSGAITCTAECCRTCCNTNDDDKCYEDDEIVPADDREIDFFYNVTLRKDASLSWTGRTDLNVDEGVNVDEDDLS